MSDVIQQALIAQIESLSRRILELQNEVERRKSRQWELRVALNNVLCLAPEGDARTRYQAVLDREGDR